MKIHTLGTLFAAVIGVCTLSPTARADGENMKIIQDTKDLKKHMKSFTKGLGVKCTACHVNKKWELEDKKMKDKTRPFFEATVGVSDEGARSKALKELLALMELDKAKNEKKLWKGIDGMKRK